MRGLVGHEPRTGTTNTTPSRGPSRLELLREDFVELMGALRAWQEARRALAACKQRAHGGR